MQKIQKQVCVIGLGHIGLPTACILADSGFSVLGIDVDEKVIARVQAGLAFDQEPGLQNLLTKVLLDNRLVTSTKVSPADIYIIAVPTPLGPSKKADLSHVYSVVDALKTHLKANNLVLIESTCPIGTTELIAEKLRNSCPGISIAYCPERVLPGNILYEFLHNDRIVGGVDDTSTMKAVSFYKSFVRGEVMGTNARTAEGVKLAENTYRDINIAYANELSMIADRLNLDVNELIRLANKHPRVNILNPGIGVGGHCIAIDPWFLISSAPDITVLATKSREINTRKTGWVVEKIKATIIKNNVKKIACLGLTYKPNVSDIRESPALAIVEALEKEFEILRIDPHVPNTILLQEALELAEMFVGLVAHDVFLNIPLITFKSKIVLDFAGVFK
jgi:UDP-N-acetyl-D-mannosaminuronic acid dehydrogenase